MTLDQLKMLLKIVETGSVVKAAESLYRTQPAVSIAMKKLEEEFELKIFSRNQYRIQLTPAGQVLYEKAKTLLKQADALETLGHQLAMGQETEIGIAIDSICPLVPILKILKELEQEFPETKIKLLGESLAGTIERLMDGDADLAVMPWMPTNQSPYLDSIYFSPLVGGPIAAPNFISEAQERELTIEEMKQHVQVIVRDSSTHSDKQTHGVIEGGKHWTVNDHSMKLEIIKNGMGWGGAPFHRIQKEFDNGELIPLNIQNYEIWSGEIRLIRRNDQPHGPVVTKLWEKFQCQAVCKEKQKH